jgi:hypothetical protein
MQQFPDRFDPKRRRVFKGGATVVLASLISRPVLGADTPWNCTISGQLSGNVSTHGEALCALEDSAASMRNTYPYPVATSSMVMISTLFSTLTTSYFFVSGATVSSGTIDGGVLSFYSNGIAPSGSTVASINQILNLPTPSGGDYAVKALVLLLNARSHAPTYPLTVSQAMALYVAAATGAHFVDTNPAVDWDTVTLRSYINLLYH